MNKIFFLFVIIFVCLFNLIIIGQIDTSVNYPLSIGDYWEYTSTDYPPYYSYVTVLKDTLMGNGKIYKIIEDKHRYSITNDFYYYYDYQRVENNLFVYKYMGEGYDCPAKEILLYDFSAPRKTFWEICGNWGHYYKGYLFFGFKGISDRYNSVVNMDLKTWYFIPVAIDTTKGITDTMWTSFYGGMPERLIAKGLGQTFITTGGAGDYILNGAIINGKKYGYITGIKKCEVQNSVDNFIFLSSFPNPFNGQTTIKITNNKLQVVEITVYDVLGRLIKTLYKGELEKGNYNFQLNSTGLPSGTYIVLLKSPSLIKTHKIINLK